MAYIVLNGKLQKVQRLRWMKGDNTGILIKHAIRERKAIVTHEAAQKKFFEKPDPALKGVKGGNCNRTACQMPGATWYNYGSRAYYCQECAHDINVDACDRYRQPRLCHPSKEAAEAFFDEHYAKERAEHESQAAQG